MRRRDFLTFTTAVAGSVVGCAHIKDALVKAGNISDMVATWIRLIESAIPGLPLSDDVKKHAKEIIDGAKRAQKTLKGLANTAAAQQDGRLDAAKQALADAYEQLYLLAEKLELLDALKRIASGPNAGDMPGTPAELREALDL